MSYKIQFVGLVYFQETIDGGGSRALVPDGRNPPENVPAIPPHFASISVAPGALEADPEGWNDDEVSEDEYQVEFFFPPSRITFQSAEVPGKLEVATQRRRLAHLSEINPAVRIDPERAIADIIFLQGELSAWLRPGSKIDDTNAAVISQVEVPHPDGESITINVEPRDSKLDRRTIRLKPGTEIAIVNASRGEAPISETGHFRIYENLLTEPPPAPLVAPPTKPGIPVSDSRHPAFTAPRVAQATPDCSNICCSSS